MQNECFGLLGLKRMGLDFSAPWLTVNYKFRLENLELEYWAYWAMIGPFGIILLGLGTFWAHLGLRPNSEIGQLVGP